MVFQCYVYCRVEVLQQQHSTEIACFTVNDSILETAIFHSVLLYQTPLQSIEHKGCFGTNLDKLRLLQAASMHHPWWLFPSSASFFLSPILRQLKAKCKKRICGLQLFSKETEIRKIGPNWLHNYFTGGVGWILTRVSQKIKKIRTD